MPAMRFELHAVDARQQVVALALEAASEAAAREIARLRGLTVFSISRGNDFLKARSEKSRSFPTLLFSIELQTRLKAGLTLGEALGTLSEKDPHSERGKVLSGILEAIRRGEPLSRALAAFPRHFPPLYVATVPAAER